MMKYKTLVLAGFMSIIPSFNNYKEQVKEINEKALEEKGKRITKEFYDYVYEKQNEEDLEKKLLQYEETKEKWKNRYGEEALNELMSLKQKLITRGHSEEEVKVLLRKVELDRRVTNNFKSNILREVDSGIISFERYSERVGLDWFVNNAQGFADEHKEQLLEIEKKYGVDARYIVGIIGIETRYGDNKTLGKHNLINSFVTQYVTLNRRKNFSEKELHYTLELSKNHKKDLTNIPCSYAGAFGVGQWLPSSVIYYSSINDFEDLFSVEGIMPSVANYLKAHGWDETKNYEELTKNGKNWKSIWRYNRSNTYVRAVDEIARGVEFN